MTDWEMIVTTIEDDPARFEEYTDELHGILENGDTEARQAVTQLLRDVADHDTSLVVNHIDLIETALHDMNVRICKTTLDTVVLLTDREQVRFPSLGSGLVAALETVHESSIEISPMWALAAISNNTSEIVRAKDELFASMLTECDEFTRQMIALNMDSRVAERPAAFPKMLRAYINGLTDSHPDVRQAAAETLAVTAQNDPDTIPNIDAVLTKMKKLRNHYDIDRGEIDHAIRTVQQAADGSQR